VIYCAGSCTREHTSWTRPVD